VPGTARRVVTAGTEIRSGLETLLISTSKGDSFLAARTGTGVRAGVTVREDSDFPGCTKRCVAVAVSDKVGFAFMIG